MKTKSILILTILLLFSGYSIRDGYSQAQTAEWMRVQSDDGEFSVEVPAAYKFFYDEDGFSIGGSNREFTLRKMEMLNSYVDGTLLSFERYSVNRDAVSIIYEADSKRSDVVTASAEIRPNGLKYRQIVSKTDRMYSIRQYFYTADHVYILTAASRGDETSAMRRFLDSVNVTMKPPASVRADATPFLKLKAVTLTIEDDSSKPLSVGNRDLQASPKADKPIVIVHKPLASYTNSARSARTTGTIAVRFDFDADGSISKAVFVRSLPNGLARQALMAGIRIKFLPAETNAVSSSSTRIVEYSFSIY